MTLWLSCSRFTVKVETRGLTIVDAAPLVRKFVGQPLANLVTWAERVGGLVRVEVLDSRKICDEV